MLKFDCIKEGHFSDSLIRVSHEEMSAFSSRSYSFYHTEGIDLSICTDDTTLASLL